MFYSYLKSISLAHRLYLGFVSVLLLLVAVAITSSYALHLQGQRVQRIVQVNNVKTALANSLMESINELAIRARSAALFTEMDQKQMAVEFNAAQAAERSFRQTESALNALMLASEVTVQEQALMAEIFAAGTKVLPEFAESLQRSLEADNVAAVLALSNRVRPVEAILRAKLTELIALESTSNEEANRDVVDLQHAVFATLSVLVIVALAMGGLIAWRITQSVTEPITRMQVMMTEIATSQDFSRRVPVGRLDEIGLSLVAFNAMIEKIQESSGLLKQSESKLAQIIGGCPVPIFVIDAQHRVTHWNRACENLVGVAAATVIGTNRQWMGFYDQARPVLADIVISAEAQGEAALERHYADSYQRSSLMAGAYEAEGFFPDMGVDGRWLGFTAAPLRDADGHFIGAIETLQDFTKRQRAEDEARRLLTEAQERSLALQKLHAELGLALENLVRTQNELVIREKMAGLGSMVAGIAHELNTPIGNSLTLASILKDDAKAISERLHSGLTRSALTEYITRNQESHDILVRSLTKAANLVQSFKQVAVDQSSSQRREFSLDEVIGEVLTSIGHVIRKAHCTVHVDTPNAIHMDSFPGSLGQIITNLINNSMIHGFEGREGGVISITATLQDVGRKTQLVVEDNGQGIAEDIIARVFDPFFTTKMGLGGSGLGLNIVYNMVTGLLGGDVHVESESGKGTRFVMNLPLQAPRSNGYQTKPDTSKHSGRTRPTAPEIVDPVEHPPPQSPA